MRKNLDTNMENQEEFPIIIIAEDPGKTLTLQILEDSDINMDTEKLISEVKKHPVLYDVKHPNYYSPKSKSDSWKAVANAIKVKDFNQCSRKWKLLKCSHKREKAKRKKDGSSDISKKRIGFLHFESMEELLYSRADETSSTEADSQRDRSPIRNSMNTSPSNE